MKISSELSVGIQEDDEELFVERKEQKWKRNVKVEENEMKW